MRCFRVLYIAEWMNAFFCACFIEIPRLRARWIQINYFYGGRLSVVCNRVWSHQFWFGDVCRIVVSRCGNYKKTSGMVKYTLEKLPPIKNGVFWLDLRGRGFTWLKIVFLAIYVLCGARAQVAKGWLPDSSSRTVESVDHLGAGTRGTCTIYYVPASTYFRQQLVIETIFQ